MNNILNCKIKLNNTEKPYENKLINYLIIILACFNLYNKGSLVLILFSLMNILILFKYSVKIDYMFVIYLIMTFFIAFYIQPEVSLNDFLFNFIKSTNFVMMYYIGYQSLVVSINKEKLIKRVVFSIFLGFSLYVIITFFYNQILYVIDDRTLICFFSKKEISVTLLGLMSVIIVGYSYYGMFIEKNIYIKLLSLFSLIIAIILNVRTATRTPLIMLLICYPLFFLIRLFKTKNLKKSLIQLFIMITIIVTLYCIYYFNMCNIKSLILESNLFERFEDEGLSTGRFDVMKEYFQLMPKYVFGGGNIENLVGTGAHNIWQQMYDIYGIFVFIPLLFSTIIMIIDLIKLMILKDQTNTTYCLIFIIVVTIIELGLEPVASSFPILFWTLILLHGITRAYIRSQYEELI